MRSIRVPTGCPLLMSGDPVASLRARGIGVGSLGAMGRLIREEPQVIGNFHEAEVGAGVDIVCAMTAATTPRALASVGMAFRAAALTGAAVDLATEAAARANRRVAIAGVLGRSIGATSLTDRLAEEYATHAARLAAAGCEILIACGLDSAHAASATPGLAHLARRAAVVSASATRLVTWAFAEIEKGSETSDGEAVDDVARTALDGGADALLFEVSSWEIGIATLEKLGHLGRDVQIGFLLKAMSNEGVDAWAGSAMRLVRAGADVIGGGIGTTLSHLAALSKAFREMRRTPFLPRVL